MIAHELFQNLNDVHLNASEEIKSRIDPANKEPGHKEAGGIYIY